MATSVRVEIKLEGSAGTGSQISTITVVTAGGLGQTLVVQPVQQTSARVNSNRQLANAQLSGTSSVHDGESNKSMDDEHRLNHTGRNTVTNVDNGHYIMTKSVPKAEPVDSDDVDHSTYVQYVEGTGKQAIFTNGEMAYPVYTMGESGTMYQTGQTHYSTPSTSSYSQVTSTLRQPTSTCHPQIIGNGTYIVQQKVDNDHTTIATAQRDSPNSAKSLDVSHHTVHATESDITNIDQLNGVESNGGMQDSGLMHANKVSSATVNWLMENYEKAEGVSLLRSTIYDNYLTYCSETKIDPVNAPSFGKLIRSVFMGLRTRRLGTRGNSKYHYYGIRIKASSLLNDFQEEENLPGQTDQSTSSKKIKFIKTEEQNCNQYTTNSSDSGNCSHNSIPSGESQAQDQEYLGDGANAIPEFPDIILDKTQLNDNCTLEDIDTFKNLYRKHYEAFLNAILNLELSTVESLWRQFWRSQDNINDINEEEQYLSKEKLYSLSKCKTLQLFVKTADFLFYQNLVKVLIPDVFRPVPRTLTQAIRHFSKGLESRLISAMQGCPEEMISIKVIAVRTFAQTLRRYTTARAVLQNYTQINQMLTDLNRVEFRNVQEQVELINNLGSENDAVHTKKRVNDTINESSEMLSDFNEPKKTKTLNYLASTSTDTERLNVLLKSPSKETEKNKLKMTINEETETSKKESEQKNPKKKEYLKKDTAMINTPYNSRISEVQEEYPKLFQKLFKKKKNEQEKVIEDVNRGEIMSPKKLNKRKGQTNDKDYSNDDFPQSVDMDEETYDNNDSVSDDSENSLEFFAAQDDFKTEYPTMTDMGLFSCQFCDKEFTNANSLSRHENVHTGKTPLECDVCFKTFISKSILCIHKRSHTGEKPYVCIICGRSFTQKSHLVLHYRTHTGEKPYDCGLCEKKFSSTSGRAEHTRRRHPYV